MTKLLQKAMAEAARLLEAEQDRIAQEVLAEVERLHPSTQARQPPRWPLSPDDLAELKAFRDKLPNSSIDAGTFVSQMRDEDWR